MTRFAAVILAAGLSSRLGEFKPLVRLGAETLLERAVGLFRRAGAQAVIAVAGHNAAKTLAEAERLGIQAVVNESYAEGMFSSLRVGLRALPNAPASCSPSCPASQLDAFFVLPVDLPLVRPQTLDVLLARFAAAPAAVLHPVFLGQRGHPPLVDARHVADILAWNGRDGLAGALQALEQTHGAGEVPVADGGIHFDVDTPADLAEARRRHQRHGIPTPEEAVALLDLHGAGARGLAHGRGVADAALALARAFNQGGAGLDLELVESAALLHDIAKGQPNHERVGAELLTGLGFPRVAEVVAAHRDIDPAEVWRLTERELVYLADKLVRGPERVGISRRFQEKLDRYAHDAEATAAIRRRLEHALAMLRLVERQAGRSLDAIVGKGLGLSGGF